MKDFGPSPNEIVLCIGMFVQTFCSPWLPQNCTIIPMRNYNIILKHAVYISASKIILKTLLCQITWKAASFLYVPFTLHFKVVTVSFSFKSQFDYLKMVLWSSLCTLVYRCPGTISMRINLTQYSYIT
jgi:hypothetical protein